MRPSRLAYRTREHLRAGHAVSASLTNERFPDPADMPALITAHAAGNNLERLSRDYDFTLFEFFLTDVAGHRPARPLVHFARPTRPLVEPVVLALR